MSLTLTTLTGKRQRAFLGPNQIENGINTTTHRLEGKGNHCEWTELIGGRRCNLSRNVVYHWQTVVHIDQDEHAQYSFESSPLDRVDLCPAWASLV